MRLINFFTYKIWRPLVCKIIGHNIICARVVYTEPDPNYFVWICHRCVGMWDHPYPCGACNNGCEDKKSR